MSVSRPAGSAMVVRMGPAIWERVKCTPCPQLETWLLSPTATWKCSDERLQRQKQSSTMSSAIDLELVINYVLPQNIRCSAGREHGFCAKHSQHDSLLSSTVASLEANEILARSTLGMHSHFPHEIWRTTNKSDFTATSISDNFSTVSSLQTAVNSRCRPPRVYSASARKRLVRARM